MAGKLECKRCFTPFDLTLHDPRLLECGHSVCLSCLDSMLAAANGNQLVCPFCNAATAQSSADPLAFKRNVTVVEALLPPSTNSTADYHPSCSRCGAQATCFCPACQKHLCASCQDAHDFFFPSTTTAHHTVDVSKLAPVELPPQPKLVKKPAEPPKPAEQPKPEPKAPAPAKRGPAALRKSAEEAPAPEPRPEPEPPKPEPRPEPQAPVAEENANEEFPKPSSNPWKKKDAAGEVTLPAGRQERRPRKIAAAAPAADKKERDDAAPMSPSAAAAAPMSPTHTTLPPATSTPTPAPAAAEGPKLLPDWAEVKDPKSGKTYYYNKKTKQTTWKAPLAEEEHPAAAAAAAEPAAAEPAAAAATETAAPAEDALPPGWAERVDPKSGRTYYYNRSTKETSWRRPAAAAAASPAVEEPLPAGWAEVKDPKSGKMYYYNKKTKETSWKRPKP